MKFAISSQTRRTISSTKNVKDILSKRIRRLMRDNISSLKMGRECIELIILLYKVIKRNLIEKRLYGGFAYF